MHPWLITDGRSQIAWIVAATTSEMSSTGRAVVEPATWASHKMTRAASSTLMSWITQWWRLLIDEKAVVQKYDNREIRLKPLIKQQMDPVAMVFTDAKSVCDIVNSTKLSLGN